MCPMARLSASVNGSVMLDILAERYGVPLIETPIGYAHIAPAMVEHTAMLGGEESGGFAFGTHLPERDAFVAALYILDLLQRRGTDIAGLRYGVEIRTGEWHYRREDVPLAAADDGCMCEPVSPRSTRQAMTSRVRP